MNWTLKEYIFKSMVNIILGKKLTLRDLKCIY